MKTFGTISCMFAIVAMAMVGCEPNNPVENNQGNGEEPKKDTVPVEVIDNSTLHHVYSVYNGSNTYGVPFHEFYSIFTTGTVKMNSDNIIVSGKGYVFTLSLLSDPQDEATFPQTGNYNVASANAINGKNYNGTLVGGFEAQNGSVYGCIVYMVNDGKIEGYDLIANGTLQLKGNSEAASIEARFMSLDSTYKFTYKGALEYANNGFCEEETYYGEPKTPITVDSIEANQFIFEGRFTVTDELDEVVVRILEKHSHTPGVDRDDYAMYIHFLASAKDTVLNGQYDVKAIKSSADFKPNIIAGSIGESYRMSHATKIYSNLRFGNSDATFYIESGSMTATPDGFTATLTSHYGSTFKYKYEGATKIVKKESSAPERIAPAQQELRDKSVGLNTNISVKGITD